ncbi:hypothetical protein [Planotetraspora kaengkrachanensis]|uniref:Tetratricopeptide repeat protein n=1 Tax=Planotetraspora kaengkrachanensis TaxID=575193 RepID=A0A8J3Q0V8_9ACTN|nr:hypothetical protein [Planotetraspora kaengkrachanensis]GIG84533.1 hypothetical protein Pka01_76600 [Planotetraspora kaengkrachanensis]
MGLFDSEARRERRLQKLQDASNAHAQEALLYWRTGSVDQAVQSNQKALDIIRGLRQEEPESDQHLAQLAGKLYNHAGMLIQGRRFDEALVAARSCVSSYLELTGGEVSRDAMMMDGLLSLAHSFRPVTTPRGGLAKLAGMTADAKCRLATALALSNAPGSAAKARRLGSEAVSAYETLVELDAGYGADLVRIREQEAEIRRLVGGRS